jgi:hypothetical protein
MTDSCDVNGNMNRKETLFGISKCATHYQWYALENYRQKTIISTGYLKVIEVPLPTLDSERS